MKYTNTDKEIEVGDQVKYDGETTTIAEIELHTDDVPTLRLKNRNIVLWDYEYENLNYTGTIPTPHIHRDVITAWANGFEIEYYDKEDEEWYSIRNPSFVRSRKYRVKPIITKSPAQLEKESIKEEMDKLSKRLEELEVE